MAKASVSDIAVWAASGGTGRESLEVLASMCGMRATEAMDASMADLKALHAAVMLKPDSGYAVADRITRKLNSSAGAPYRPDPRRQFDPIDPTPKAGLPDVLGGGKGLTENEVRKIALDAFSGTIEGLSRDMQAELTRQVKEAATGIADQIADAVQKALDTLTPTNLVVTTAKDPLGGTALGLVHHATPRIIRALGRGLNVYLHGPAGSGKTTVGRKCAEAFGLKFYTAAKVESEYLLLGFKDAQGNTVRTQFREAYEHGGVFLFDEMDASSPGAIVALNMALANGMCPFPDGTVERHKDFKCLGAGNTTLTGANRQYVGRTQLDAASVDRFYFVEFPYDEVLERTLATNKDWCDHVQAIRAVIKERGLNHLVTPRATLDGCVALDMGDTWEEAEASCVFKGLDADTVEQIKQALKPAKKVVEPSQVWQPEPRLTKWSY